jgi:thermitase
VLRTLPLVLLALVLLFPGSAAADPAARIIVEREPGLTAAERADLRRDAGVRLVDRLPLPRTEVVTAPAGRAAAALRELRADADVVYAEPDAPRHALAADPDPHLGLQWAIPRIRLADAWGMSTGTGQTVAVVDSGVEATHPDLAGGVLSGRDWVEDDDDPDDLDGHGTHVAGIVAARRDNGRGGAGGAPDARILPLRVLDEDGGGFVSHIVEAFDFAGQRGIRVVNASFGGDSHPAERAAIARYPNTLFVAAAGNGGHDFIGDDNDVTPEYPCSYDLANILCVGASTDSDTRADFSNYGSESVDLFAPGEDIWSTLRHGTYGFNDGTSMATPYAAAAAALLFARNPALTPADVKTALMENVDTSFAFGESVSRGRVNAAAALTGFDHDRDGRADGVDACPSQPGPGAGCPGDADGDGLLDTADNCPGTPNSNQSDADGDGAGDACDATPRGPDVDGDGKAALDDACPNQPAATANGCPLPPPPDSDGDGRIDVADACPTEAAATVNGCPVPVVRSAKAKVNRRKRTVRLTVRADRAATVRVTVERKKCRKGKRCRWVRTARRTVNARTGRAKIVLRRAKKGSYRAVVRVSSDAGRAPTRRVRFRVR